MHQPTEMVDVEIVLRPDAPGGNAAAADALRGVGADVVSVDDDDGVLEATFPASLLDTVKAMAAVAVVRVIFAYVAAWPAP